MNKRIVLTWLAVVVVSASALTGCSAAKPAPTGTSVTSGPTLPKLAGDTPEVAQETLSKLGVITIFVDTKGHFLNQPGNFVVTGTTPAAGSKYRKKEEIQIILAPASSN